MQKTQIDDDEYVDAGSENPRVCVTINKAESMIKIIFIQTVYQRKEDDLSEDLSSLEGLLESTNQVYIGMPAKAAGVSMRQFA